MVTCQGKTLIKPFLMKGLNVHDKVTMQQGELVDDLIPIILMEADLTRIVQIRSSLNEEAC